MILVVDSGTTSTRTSVVRDRRVLATAIEKRGARDVARTNDRSSTAALVRELGERALADAAMGWEDVEAIVAFGMITSELGLEEVPHVEAPVDAAALADAIVERRYDALPAPVLLVPGVRTGGEDARSADFMRGEETEVAGLLALGEVAPPLLYVSTGSHTKFVEVDAGGRIVWSFTTLSGELLWALHRETILAGLIEPTGSPGDLAALEDGAASADELGLSRALFVTRLLNRVEGATAATCSSFAIGAIAGADLAALARTREGRGALDGQIAIGGTGPLADAYRHLLTRRAGTEPRSYEEPLGALGAWVLFTRNRDAMPAGAPDEGS